MTEYGCRNRDGLVAIHEEIFDSIDIHRRRCLSGRNRHDADHRSFGRIVTQKRHLQRQGGVGISSNRGGCRSSPIGFVDGCGRNRNGNGSFIIQDGADPDIRSITHTPGQDVLYADVEGFGKLRGEVVQDIDIKGRDPRCTADRDGNLSRACRVILPGYCGIIARRQQQGDWINCWRCQSDCEGCAA